MRAARRRARAARLAALLTLGVVAGCAHGRARRGPESAEIERLERQFARAERQVLEERERLAREHEAFARALLDRVRQRRRRDEGRLLLRQLRLEPQSDDSGRLALYLEQLSRLYDALETAVRDRSEQIMELLLLERDEHLELLEAERLHRRAALEAARRGRGE